MESIHTSKSSMTARQDSFTDSTSSSWRDSSHSKVTVIDYSPDYMQERNIDAHKEPLLAALNGQKPFGVRWIVVNGLSKDILKQITLHYNVDEAAVEDMLENPHRTKMESFSSYKFCHYALHHLQEREYSPLQNMQSPFLWRGLLESNASWSRRESQVPRIHALKRKNLKSLNTKRFHTSTIREVTVEHICLIFGDDFVVTIFECESPLILQPLLNRLRSSSTLLRQQSSALSLVHSIMDVSVDLVGVVSADYRQRLMRLQRQATDYPSTQQMRKLHHIASDICVLRDGVSSIRSLISKVYDHSHSYPNASSEYFLAVVDHAQCHLEEFDLMNSYARSLSSLVFNTMSIHASNSMLMLSVVTAVFMPLTFLAGYFGMNFKTFDVLKNDASYFWMMAAPAAGSLFIILIYPLVWDLALFCWNWCRDQREQLLKFENEPMMMSS